jgi:hypothetical protein
MLSFLPLLVKRATHLLAGRFDLIMDYRIAQGKRIAPDGVEPGMAIFAQGKPVPFLVGASALARDYMMKFLGRASAYFARRVSVYVKLA